MTWRTGLAGALLGVLYTLSPLSVVTGAIFAGMLTWLWRTTEGSERNWLITLVTLAVVLRALAIGGLFLTTDHTATPFGTFFGDEDYFIKRGLWLRNIAAGIPISPADMRYAFDPFIHTSYVWMLALLQLVFGPSPYGVHLVSALAYVGGVLLLYRLVRPSFGLAAAMTGLAVLLFMPSLFLWSTAALKDPIFMSMVAVVLALLVASSRRRSWLLRGGAAVAVAATIWAAQSMREGAAVMLGLGVAGGLVLGLVASNRRFALGLLIAAIVVVPAAASRGAVKDRVVATVHRAAQSHWDHVNAKGYVYTFLPPRFYAERKSIETMTFNEGVSFIANGVGSYLAVPLPWHIKSNTALAFLPEQVLWYGLVLLAPIGIWAGFRRDPFLSAMLLAQAAAALLLVAVTSGNVGTMVRHRGLAILELAWFSGLGLSTALAWAAAVRAGAQPSPRQTED